MASTGTAVHSRAQQLTLPCPGHLERWAVEHTVRQLPPKQSALSMVNEKQNRTWVSFMSELSRPRVVLVLSSCLLFTLPAATSSCPFFLGHFRLIWARSGNHNGQKKKKKKQKNPKQKKKQNRKTPHFYMVILQALTFQSDLLIGRRSAVPRAKGHHLQASQWVPLAKLKP